MRAGGVGLCMATLIARTPVGATAIHGGLLDYPTPAAAGAVATGQLAWYRALEEAGEVALLATGDELQTHARRWRTGEERRVGIVLAMEGSDPIISPEARGNAGTPARPAGGQPGALRAGTLRRRHRSTPTGS